ncbi:hypothetical protein [Microcoleus sp. S13_C5]|uniref:hypothetical protein n=1 Tax=Microcoleus sp. S13_C5 TaxID=3055411 RepID=UPI002FD2FD8E
MLNYLIEDTPVTNLYILERGQADRYRRKQPGLMWGSSLLPGAIGVALMGNLSTGNLKVHPNPIQHRSNASMIKLHSNSTHL